ncbi:hypothetical protein JW707_00990 [Candidatus Woesearchaeota archaeon]|nr:hypothetical protein [Candidatus Woesearchaeota archaeon]
MSYNSSCGYCSAAPVQYGSSANYSALESAVEGYQPVMRMSAESLEQPVKDESFIQKEKEYLLRKSAAYSSGLYLSNGNSRQYYFSPSAFLNSTPTEFISSEDEQQKEIVKNLAEEAFIAATGKEFPKDIALRICSEETLKKIHETAGGKWAKGIRGFSINRRGFGPSHVFVMEDELARMMLTLGHEIGHVITLPMKNAVDEEAKAFAFSMAWMKSIKENNIGGLSESINPAPAKNGLHNVAFDFVLDLIRKGRQAIDVYLELIRGEVSISNQAPVY